MSPSLYGFVKEREPVSPEEVASGFLNLPNLNGGARSRVEELTAGDSRFVWSGEYLKTADVSSLALGEATYVVFDLETTGSSSKEGAITEFGAVKIKGGKVVGEFSSLVNPQRPIEPFVVGLTGITDEMVADAPKVGEVLPLFEEFVEGAALVAHNARFDCSFVEAVRGGTLPNPVLDTLRLARTLVPGLARYKLAALAEHFGVEQVPNHRALADAAVTAEVFLKLLGSLRKVGIETVGEAAALKGGRRRIKPQKQHLAEGLPGTPGVYYFLDKEGNVLYVGKAKNLRARVRTYFNGGDGRRKIGRLVEEVAKVEVRETKTELHALILEAREIKRLLPRYNTVGREERPGWFIKLDTREPYPVPERVPAGSEETGVVLLGPYRSAGALDVCVEALGRIFPLRRCSQVEPGTEPCFYGQMGRCAPCSGMSEEEYEIQVVGGIAKLLRGEGGEEHLAALARERDRLAKALEFEAAARLRDLISGIERIRFTRTLTSAKGLRAVVASSTEPDVLEVFVLSGGRLVAHEGFSAGDRAGISRFAGEALLLHEAGVFHGGESGAGEARVVAAYLRKRTESVEAVRLGGAEDLVRAVERLARSLGKPERRN